MARCCMVCPLLLLLFGCVVVNACEVCMINCVLLYGVLFVMLCNCACGFKCV